MQLAPEIVREAAGRAGRTLGAGAIRPLVGSEFPLAEAAAAHALIETRRARRQGRPCPVRAAPALRHRQRVRDRRCDRRRSSAEEGSVLARSRRRVRRRRARAWGSVDDGRPRVSERRRRSPARERRGRAHRRQYRRASRANVDGVVFGDAARRRLMPNGGAIVATASLAGLIAMPLDPIYALTKHAVIGFVRSVAPQLASEGHPHQRGLPGLHRHADGPGRAAHAARRATDGAIVRRGRCDAGAGRRGDRRRLGRAAEPRLRFRFPNIPGRRAAQSRGWGGDLPSPHVWRRSVTARRRTTARR